MMTNIIRRAVKIGSIWAVTLRYSGTNVMIVAPMIGPAKKLFSPPTRENI
jgi:hypothetical protein